MMAELLFFGGVALWGLSPRRWNAEGLGAGMMALALAAHLDFDWWVLW